MKRIRKKLIAFLAMLLIGITVVSNIEQPDGELLTVHFIDVGQGDAILLQYEGTNVLVDTGTESQYKNLTNYLRKIGVKQINDLVVTHPDADHMGASDLVIQDYKVSQIYMTKYKNNTNEYKQMIKAIKKYEVKRINVKEGSKIPVGKLKAQVLAADSNAEDSNSSSIVMKLKHGNNSFLFTGDAPAKAENRINKIYDLKVDVLKVAHHGSSYSSPISCIKAESPQFAVISVGKDNRYGHPVETVLKRLNKYSGKVLRTDEDGTIVISSDGTSLKCKTLKTGDIEAIDKLQDIISDLWNNIKEFIEYFKNSLK